MTFTGRIRASLILLAVVPTLLVMTAIYLLGDRQASRADRVAAARSLERFEQFRSSFEGELQHSIAGVRESPEFRRAVILLRAGRASGVRLDAPAAGLDFVEITDPSGLVLVSRHRPGLVGERLPGFERLQNQSACVATSEYDVDGRHAALTNVAAIDSLFRIYAGRYLDSAFVHTAGQLTGADIRIEFAPDSGAASPGLTVGQLYEAGDSLRASLLGGDEAGFHVAAAFGTGPDRGIFGNLLLITGLVALLSILIATGLGMYIAGRTKREFDNLLSATARVADGDFSTPVMAFEEGEFAQLADSFTEMTFKLREAQRRLATSEKIAAWQAVGRKIAHEIKNPLTPIAISTDDLRRSYHEQLADFPQILNETTATIKSEVARLTRLLDEFVRFARMNPPVLRDVAPGELVTPLETLYRAEIASARLQIANASMRSAVNLDPGAVHQVLVNLIKNGLESSPESRVSVALGDDGDRLAITVSDTGPGFPAEVLARGLEPYVSTKKGGSGLGLVISQRIVYDHGGTLDIGNRPEGGAVVTIKLPVTHG